jgi:hypothetical protein
MFGIDTMIPTIFVEVDLEFFIIIDVADIQIDRSHAV